MVIDNLIFDHCELTITEHKLWENCPGLKQGNSLLGNFDQKKSNAYMQLNRQSLRQLTEFLKVHCKLRKYLTMGLDFNDRCRFCKETKENPELVLTNCSIAFIRKTIRCLCAYYDPTEYLPP